MNNNVNDHLTQQFANYLVHTHNQNVNRNNQHQPQHPPAPNHLNQPYPAPNQPQVYINGNRNQLHNVTNAAVTSARLGVGQNGGGNAAPRGGGNPQYGVQQNIGSVAMGVAMGPRLNAGQLQQPPNNQQTTASIADQIALTDAWASHFQHSLDMLSAYRAGLQFQAGGNNQAYIAAGPGPPAVALEQGLGIGFATGIGQVIGEMQLNGGIAQAMAVGRTTLAPAAPPPFSASFGNGNINANAVNFANDAAGATRLTVDPDHLATIPSIQPPTNVTFHNPSAQSLHAGPSKTDRYKGLARSPERANGLAIHVDIPALNEGATLAVSSQPITSPIRSPSTSHNGARVVQQDASASVPAQSDNNAGATQVEATQRGASGQARAPTVITTAMLRSFQVWAQKRKEADRRNREAAQQAKLPEAEQHVGAGQPAAAAGNMSLAREGAVSGSHNGVVESARTESKAEAEEQRSRAGSSASRKGEISDELSEGSGNQAEGRRLDGRREGQQFFATSTNLKTPVQQEHSAEASKEMEQQPRRAATYATAALQDSLQGTSVPTASAVPSSSSPVIPEATSQALEPPLTANETAATSIRKVAQSAKSTQARASVTGKHAPPAKAISPAQKMSATRPGPLKQAELWRAIRREIHLPPVDGRNIYSPLPDTDKENEVLYFEYRVAEMLHRGTQDFNTVNDLEKDFIKRLVHMTRAKGLEMLYGSMYEGLRGRVEQCKPRVGPAKRLLEMLKQKGISAATKRTASGQTKEAEPREELRIASETAPVISEQPQPLVFVNGNAYHPTENAVIVIDQENTGAGDMEVDSSGGGESIQPNSHEQGPRSAETMPDTKITGEPDTIVVDAIPAPLAAAGARSSGSAGSTAAGSRYATPTTGSVAPAKKRALLPINTREVRSIPVNRMYVEIPTKRPPVTRVFEYADPEPLPFRFNRTSKNPVLDESLVKRKCLRYCEWEGCDAELSSEWHLEQHVRRHLKSGMLDKRTPGERDAWTCCWEDCATYLYATKEDLYQHVKAVHVQKSFRCPYSTCPTASEKRPKVYPTITSLEGHIARHPDQHKKKAVLPLMVPQTSAPSAPMKLEVPATLPASLVASQVVVHRGTWANSRSKRIGINLVQEMSFIDKESPKMSAGEEPHSMDVPQPTVVDLLDDSDSDLEVAMQGGLNRGAVKVKQEPGEEPEISAKKALREQGEKGKERETGPKFDIIMEIKRPVVWGK